MALRLTLLSFLLGLPRLLHAAAFCETGDAACAAHAAALLQRNSRQQSGRVDAGEESLYESLYESGPMMIEGKFHWVYDPDQYAGKPPEEVARMQEDGQLAVREALAELVGFGLAAADIALSWETVASLAQVGQVPTTTDVLCTFTFQCPGNATPEEVTGSMSNITTRSFLNVLVPKITGLGMEPFAFKVTTFLGATTVTSTAAPSSSAGPNSTMPISTSLLITTAEPAVDLHPCKSLDDFLPDAKMDDFGWCAITTQPSEGDCELQGCKPYGYPDYPSCHCDAEGSCAAVGGTWSYHTCQAEMDMYQNGEYRSLMEAAMAAGSCAGLQTTWHTSLSEVLEWPARKCCASWPQTMCEPTATLATPCKDPGDFLADHITDQGVTCTSWLKQWWQEYATLKNATAAGTCDGFALPWGEELKSWVTHPAKQCCASFPATVCDRDAVYMTPCLEAKDFHAEQVLSEHCHFDVVPNSTTCSASGCTYEHSWCHCSEALCAAAGGSWHTQTCGNEMLSWDLAVHAALQEAAQEGSCLDLEYSGDLAQRIEWPAKKCCTSFPATVCAPAAKRATPCKDEADFVPGNVQHEWCDLQGHAPDESTCQSHGCHWDGAHCHCPSQASCIGIGGLYMTRSCGEDLAEQSAEWHEAVLAGNCSENSLHGTQVDDLISWASKKCCASYPANACYKDLQKMTPCKDEADFLPGNMLHEWCDFQGTVPEACGTTPGCHSGEHHCHCDTKEGCMALGGIWTQRTCGAEVGDWDVKYHLSVQEAALGSCDDVDMHGQPLTSHLRYPAQRCCASYPASICDPTAKKMTPCKDEADFMPASVLNEWCHMSTEEQRQACVGHGSCDTAAKCEAAGATWTVHTCGGEISQWEPEKHKALQEAFESGTCGVHSAYGDLAQTIQWPAEKCCASFPATVCDTNARAMTPCKDEGDYTPEMEMWAHCDFHGDGAILPDETTCNNEPGCYGGEGWCHCADAASCQAVGGIWNAHTCAMEIGQWRPEQHKMLQRADELGTCVDLEVNGMRAQDMVSWPAQKCCQSYPATVCDKGLAAMTPCLRSQDFLHNKTMWAWCEGLYPAPPEHDCLAQGCTGNEHYCHCETAEACSALGGHWTEYQCWQDLQWMASEVHKGIARAIGQGTCEDVEAHRNKLEYAVDWLGSNCCSSGMSVCQELAAGGSTYESSYR